MSVIRKKPFIESVLDTLTTSELSSLKYVMNNGGNNVSVSLVSGSFEKGEGKIITSTITPVYLEVESNKFYSAILIWNASYCVAIPYHRFQDVKLIKINPSTRTYEEIKEYCDINELRRIIDDTAESSFDADGEAGQVLTADGEGGVQWKDNPQIIALTTNSGTLTSDQVALASAGNTVFTLNGEYYYRFSKSVSAIVFKATPRVDSGTTYIDNITIDLSDNTYSASYETVAEGEGFSPTYDDELSDSSTNAVQNKVINAALALKADVTDLEDYAKISDLENGTVVPEKSKVAENLLPVSQASGSTQTAPFINQGTATNNNDAQAEVDTGTLGQHLEKRGNTVVVNQGAKEISSDNWTSAGTSTITYSSGVATITAGASNSGIINRTDNAPMRFVTGHLYLMFATIKLTTATNQVQLYANGGYGTVSTTETTNWQTLSHIFTGVGTDQQRLVIRDRRSSDWDAIQVKDIYLIDLTQWFNGDIPQDLLDNPSNFYRYYQGSLAYNVGQLVNCNGRYLVNGGQNVWDEEWELGNLNDETGAVTPSSTKLVSKNFIPLIPNRTYYYKSSENATIVFYDANKNYVGKVVGGQIKNTTFTTPSNAMFMKFNLSSTYGTTYNHDITISLYYEGEDYSKYIPYEAPKVYDTGNEELLAFDKKLPDGTIYHNTGTKTIVGSTDVGEVSTAYTTIKYFYINKPTNYKYRGSYEKTFGNTVFKKFIPTEYQGSYDSVSLIGTVDGTASGNQLWFGFPIGTTLEQAKEALDGETFQYELADASKTTEQGTPFSENMDINDMGNMAWYSAYTDENTNTPVEVPQGCKIFYPAWYVGFIDTLGQREDIQWAPDEIVSQTQLGVVDIKIGAKLPACPTDTNGTYVLKATVSDGAVTYSWVAENDSENI